MKPRDLAELVLLASLWGASFLFMRLGAGAFGPVALSFVRVAGACLYLVPMLLWRGEASALRTHWRPILTIGITNSALPFLLYSLATLAISGGLAAIFNATSPLWAAVIAWVWLQRRLPRLKVLGLAIGFAGVLGLALGHASFKANEHGISPTLAILACIAATSLYGFSGNYTQQRLAGVPPIAVAAGSQLAASLFLAGPAALLWPAQNPAARAWVAAALLAVVCTGVAYALYFRLIVNVGPANAISVTFLVPAFAALWGALVLGETLTPQMLVGCAVILVGTALTTGSIGNKSGKRLGSDDAIGRRG